MNPNSMRARNSGEEATSSNLNLKKYILQGKMLFLEKDEKRC